MIVWNPLLPAWIIAVVVLATVVGLRWLYRRLAARGAVLALIPAVITAVLVLLALVDPRLRLAAPSGERTLWLVVDRSASMHLRDGAGTRQERAEAIARRLATAAPGARIAWRWCDTAVHERRDAPQTDAGTDLGACLQALAPMVAAADSAAVVLLTDGGDETITAAGLPTVPIATVAIGGDPARADDVGITAITAPETAEPAAHVQVAIDVAARGGAAFRQRLGAHPLTIAQSEDGTTWTTVETRQLDLRQGRARVELDLRAATTPGTLHLRATLAPVAGQLSALDDARTCTIAVHPRSLRVLYASRSLGVEVKHLRSALARDPGVAFTATYRTVGERFAVQGEAADGLDRGLPARLAGWDVVVLGSFPAAELEDERQRALAAWVQDGGGLALVGGDALGGAGGWQATPLAPLFPWQIGAGEPLPERGQWPVAPAASGHPILAGLAAGGTIPSRNRPGALRPGATAILDSPPVALAAAHTYGRGRVLGVASDALWHLPTDSYGAFWRNAVRWLADRAEGARGLRVRWDRGRYRPGDLAQVAIEVSEPGVTLRAQHAAPGANAVELVPEPAGRSQWSLAIPLSVRGEHRLTLTAGEATYERSIPVAPLLPEGARPGRDDAGLADLARRSEGLAASEEDVTALAAWIGERCRRGSTTTLTPLVTGTPWWFATLMLALLSGWWIRRWKGML